MRLLLHRSQVANIVVVLSELKVDASEEAFRAAVLEGMLPPNGKLELRLVWPQDELAPQHWKQRSNPYLHRQQSVEGYEPVHCPHETQGWGGLEAGHRDALMDGSVHIPHFWFYAVGSYNTGWGGGIEGGGAGGGQMGGDLGGGGEGGGENTTHEPSLMVAMLS